MCRFSSAYQSHTFLALWKSFSQIRWHIVKALKFSWFEVSNCQWNQNFTNESKLNYSLLTVFRHCHAWWSRIGSSTCDVSTIMKSRLFLKFLQVYFECVVHVTLIGRQDHVFLGDNVEMEIHWFHRVILRFSCFITDLV